MSDSETTHLWPLGAGGKMPCCHRTMFDVPVTDRMTSDPELATCGGPFFDDVAGRCWFQSFGRCVKPDGHDGDHLLRPNAEEQAALVAIGLGKAPITRT